MKRTQEEIVRRIEERKDEDTFGFETTDYISFLDYDHAKPWLDGNVTREEWETEDRRFDPREEMKKYMPFAWEKAKRCRGLSAMRSIQHFMAWLWLDGNAALADSIQEYEYYGKPQLRQICEYLGLDADQWDDGVRTNTEEV